MEYKLFDKYKDKHLSDFTRGSGRKIHYFIPPEYVINEVVTNSIYLTSDSEKAPESNWLSNKYMSKFLKEATGYTIQEWYDIIELHLTSPDQRPHCNNPNCRRELYFSGRLNYGYNLDRYNPGKVVRKFCDYNCRKEVGLAGWNLQWTRDKESMKSIVSSQGAIVKQYEIKGYNASLDLNFILSTDDHDQGESSVYLVECDDRFKVGYSKYEIPWERLRICKVDRFHRKPCNVWVFRGPWHYMAKLEYHIKYDLWDYRIPEEGFEVFHKDKLPSILNNLLRSNKIRLVYNEMELT